MATKKIKKEQLQPSPKKQAAKITPSTIGNYYVLLFIIVLLSFIAYLPSIKGGFVWDDEGYLQINTLVRTINLKQIFSEYVMGNYHPLTMLVYCIEYRFFGLNPAGYHVINLLLHLLNVVLVFYAVLRLSNKTIVALVAALLFGIHPVHVESVAWASELKDLLYTAFFLGSYIYYLKYLQYSLRRYYFIALLLFAFSLLSKAMAASLPVILLLTDYFKNRKMNTKTWLEKAPFFVLAIGLGVLAVVAQQSSGATDVDFYPVPQRLIFACYNIISYLIKLVLPLDLSAYYTYPILSGESVPAQLYIYPLLFLCLAAYTFYSLRFTKKIFFGIGFFLVTVFLVLQLLPVGGAVMADRYCYIPSIGIFYLAGEGFFLLWSKAKNTRSLSIALLSIFIIFFSVKTYAQSAVWKNGFTLWNDVISRSPSMALAYHNRGLYFVEQQRDEEAINDFTKAIQLKPDYADVYNNRGLRYENEKRYAEAILDYGKVIQFKPNDAKAYANRGNAFYITQKYDSALIDLNKAIQLNPTIAEPYNNRGAVYMVNSRTYDKAQNDFNAAIKINPDYVSAYSNRALLFGYEKKYDAALKDFAKAIEIQPDFVKAYSNRAILYTEMKKFNEAFNDYSRAIDLQPANAELYNGRGILYMNEQKYDAAFVDFSKAIELQPAFASAYYNRGVSEFDANKKDSACSDFQKAGILGYANAAATYQGFCH